MFNGEKRCPQTTYPKIEPWKCLFATNLYKTRKVRCKMGLFLMLKRQTKIIKKLKNVYIHLRTWTGIFHVINLFGLFLMEKFNKNPQQVNPSYRSARFSRWNRQASARESSCTPPGQAVGCFFFFGWLKKNITGLQGISMISCHPLSIFRWYWFLIIWMGI